MPRDFATMSPRERAEHFGQIVEQLRSAALGACECSDCRPRRVMYADAVEALSYLGPALANAEQALVLSDSAEADARADERKAIITWLRGIDDDEGPYFADRIERGEHIPATADTERPKP